MRRLIAAKVLALCLVGTAQADQWTFFHPESVKTFGCRVVLTDMQINGEPSTRQDQWEAEATAVRTDGSWAFSLGFFPPNPKGRHQAEKVCSKWVDEAEKRVRKAR